VHFDPALRDEVVRRYETLGVPSYTGFVMPRLSPVWGADGALADVTISYPESLATQMLEWSGRRLPPVALPADPAALYHDVLQRLLAAPELELGFHIEVSGANTGTKDGMLRLRAGNLLDLRAEGPFNGTAQPISVTSDGAQFSGTAAGATLTGPIPAALHDGLLKEYMVRGLMHNLAMLSMGRPLSLADGTPEGAVATGFRALPDGQIDGRATRRIAWEIQVGGEKAADVELDVSESTGLPLQRRVVVHFPQGDMTVVESYALRRPVGGASVN